ncbi:sugar transporter [Liberibacter crescens]|nr:sugar transporter [Liberibacter crescens]
MIIAVGAYSVLTIILGSYATLWTENKDDQTRIAAAREAFGLIGLIIAVSMPSFLFHIVNPNHVFIWYGVILAILMLGSMLGFYQIFSPLFYVEMSRKKQSSSFLSGLCALPKQSIRLFIVYFVSMVASSIPAVLVIFYVRDFLEAENLIGVFLFFYFLSGVLGIPFWKKASKYFGKYKAWFLSNIPAILGFYALFLGAKHVDLYCMVCLISGFSLGADLILPPSILSDDIHAHKNSQFSATHYALLAFISKASFALASAIALPVLDLAGFRPQALNTENALKVLSVCYSLIPCILKLVSAVLLYAFFIRSQSGVNNETI